MLSHYVLVIFALFPFTTLQGFSQDSQEMKGFRAEFTGLFDREASHAVQLAWAIPQDKYSWRPADGVRSIGEVYAHIAAANTMFAAMIAGEEFDFKGMPDAEKKERTKAEMKSELEASTEKVKGLVSRMTDADLEKMVTIPFIPNPMSARAVLMLTLSHFGEHMGQSIAYARMNNVVPPWTAAQGAE